MKRADVVGSKARAGTWIGDFRDFAALLASTLDAKQTLGLAAEGAAGRARKEMP